MADDRQTEEAQEQAASGLLDSVREATERKIADGAIPAGVPMGDFGALLRQPVPSGHETVLSGELSPGPVTGGTVIGIAAAAGPAPRVVKSHGRRSVRAAKAPELNYAGASLRHTGFEKAKMAGADFSRAELWDVSLHGTDLTAAKFVGAKLRDLDASKANLSGADLSDASLAKVQLEKANLSGAILFGTDLSGSTLLGADLRGAFLTRVKLDRVRFGFSEELEDDGHRPVALAGAHLATGRSRWRART